MSFHDARRLIEGELSKTGGILRFAPAWVARQFLTPGRRLKLDPRDYYAYGGAKGGIDERWLSSVTPADNGPYTAPDEGLSYVVVETSGGAARVLFRDIIDFMGEAVIGAGPMNRYGGWVSFAKLFDNMGPIGLHVHPSDAVASAIGQRGKPEGYYFPPQQNNVFNNFPHTFFGLNPGVTKEDVAARLRAWDSRGDNNILDLSRAFRLELGTGWDVPPGILHAPGSLLTYEPQRASDVASFFQSQVEGRASDRSALTAAFPPDKADDYEYILGILDWKLNLDPDFKKRHHLTPVPVADEAAMAEKGFGEKWIVYGSPHFCAKELTVFPGRSATVADEEAYGLLVVQGHGAMNRMDVESPSLIRFGELTADEMFVTEEAAQKGVAVVNRSRSENLVMLKHFGPEHPGAAHLLRNYDF